MTQDVDYVLAKLDWMRAERIWPNGLRYLWTDAFGVVLYVSLHRATQDEHWLDAAKALVVDVERVLGRRRGIRIGQAPERDGQYFHYLAMWLFALARLGELESEYRERGLTLARDVHRAFVLTGRERDLEDAGGSERAVSRLRPRRHGRLRRLRLLSPARRIGFGARDRRNKGADRTKLLESRHRAGPGPRHDALARSFPSRRELGQATE